MTPVMLATIAVGDPIPQPAPGWLLWFLLVLTFFLHVLPMNFVLGGSILAAATASRTAGTADPYRARLLAWMGKAMPVIVATAITFGVAPLLFLQVLFGRVFFSSSILMGWSWLAVVPILILAYYGTYVLSFKSRALGVGAAPLRWIVAFLFLCIAFIYTNNMSMMLRIPLFGALYRQDGRGTHLNFADPTWAPRFLHFALAAVAVAGIFVATYGLVTRKRDAGFASWTMRYGAKWFAVSTAANLLAGFWFLLVQPKDTLIRFMGQDPVATLLLAVGILAGMSAMVMMFLAINAPEPGGLVRGSLSALALTLFGMILTRDQIRRAALEAVGFRAVPWIESQWVNIALFAALLVAALATVAWMVRALLGAGGTRAAGESR